MEFVIKCMLVLLKGTNTQHIVVIWVKNLQTELMVDI